MLNKKVPSKKKENRKLCESKQMFHTVSKTSLQEYYASISFKTLFEIEIGIQ